MIAVLANESEHPAVREFFQLFKTPWQFYRPDSPCEVLICAGTEVPETSAKLIVVYGASEPSVGSDSLPIFCGVAPLHRAKDARSEVDDRVVRFGFNLFREVEFLLTRGQPAEFAHIPTLDLHIETLRDLFGQHGIAFYEIPPAPVGHDFIACLTHDVDHPRLRNHFCDHTMFGFLERALVGSLIDLFRGRKNLRQVAANYWAALTLPFVYLGLARDFWDQFDRYREIEDGAKSTFFVVPEKGNPGVAAANARPAKRAVSYQLADIESDLRRAADAGCEIATHGIDAWRDSARGKGERAAVEKISCAEEIGVRMHWLFWDQQSHKTLEAAGYSYDSTIGYNQTIGYRAGTHQAFKPLDVEHLLELPMHVMDTALFYPSYLHRSAAVARAEIAGLTSNAARFGGVLTVNWHDRSLAPERQWDGSYIDLVADLKRRGAWMPTASEAVAWFRARRAISIETEDGIVRVTLPETVAARPAFRLRAHDAGGFTDFPFKESRELDFAAEQQTASAA